MMSVLQVFREVDGAAQLIGFIKEAAGIVRDLQKKLPDALSDAASHLAREGYDGARAIAGEIIENAAPRCGLR